MKREEDAAESIRRLIAYTKDLKDVGTRPAEWQNVKQVVEQAAGFIEGLTIKIEIAVDPKLEVYADPLFRKIFSNMMENTHVHGKKASFIRIFSLESGDGIVLVFEDDGEGIPLPDKEKNLHPAMAGQERPRPVFRERGTGPYGNDHFGKGRAGKGARFEILVPAGGA